MDKIVWSIIFLYSTLYSCFVDKLFQFRMNEVCVWYKISVYVKVIFIFTWSKYTRACPLDLLIIKSCILPYWLNSSCNIFSETSGPTPSTQTHLVATLRPNLRLTRWPPISSPSAELMALITERISTNWTRA